MEKQRWLQIVLVIICITLLIGTYAMFYSNNEEEKVTDSPAPVMGMVVTVTEDEWQEDAFRSIREHAKAGGYEIMTIQAERSQAEQIEAIRALIVYRVDVIVLLPVVDSGWDAVMIEAREANIPVISADKGIRNSDKFVVSHVGYNYYTAAVAAAEILAAQAQSSDTIIEIYGTLGASAAKDLTRGFREALTRSGLKIHSSVSGDYMCSRGREITEGFLKSGDGTDIIIAHNDAMALGAVEAIEEQGQVPGQDVKIFAVGGGKETLALLADGKLNCLISRSTKKLGAEVVRMAGRLRQGNLGEDEEVLIETEILTAGEVVQ